MEQVKRVRQEEPTEVIATAMPNPSIGEIESRLTEAQEKMLNDAHIELTADQLKAARLEATGLVDRVMLAGQLKVTPQTITNWRSNQHYKNVVTITALILGQYSREFRANCERSIIAPIIMEIMDRINNPATRQVMDFKDLISAWTKISKEMRFDTSGEAKDKQDDNELVSLQKIRQANALQAEQAIALKKLKSNQNIIQFPDHLKIANG